MQGERFQGQHSGPEPRWFVVNPGGSHPCPRGLGRHRAFGRHPIDFTWQARGDSQVEGCRPKPAVVESYGHVTVAPRYDSVCFSPRPFLSVCLVLCFPFHSVLPSYLSSPSVLHLASLPSPAYLSGRLFQLLSLLHLTKLALLAWATFLRKNQKKESKSKG